MQATPGPQMSRVQKLKWYAGQLMTDATDDEKKDDKQTAISHYLQAADLLLLLAKAEQNYTSWKDFTDKATFCQQKARGLIALVPKNETGPV
jgi:hypothetical protein